MRNHQYQSIAARRQRHKNESDRLYNFCRDRPKWHTNVKRKLSLSVSWFDKDVKSFYIRNVKTRAAPACLFLFAFLVFLCVYVLVCVLSILLQYLFQVSTQNARGRARKSERQLLCDKNITECLQCRHSYSTQNKHTHTKHTLALLLARRTHATHAPYT